MSLRPHKKLPNITGNLQFKSIFLKALDLLWISFGFLRTIFYYFQLKVGLSFHLEVKGISFCPFRDDFLSHCD